MRLPRLTLVPIIASLLLGGLLVPAPAARAVGVWAPAPSPASAFASRLVPLANGQVLLVDGASQRYDPATDTWSAPVSPTTPGRYNYAAVGLADGRALVIGGSDVGPLASVDRYDPATDRWEPVAPMGAPRARGHTATLLADGRVLVVGGVGPRGTAPTAELYDPVREAWVPAGDLGTARAGHTATRLPDGRVLVAGGMDDRSRVLASAELYDPATDRWSAAPPMDTPRSDHRATPLVAGRVLVLGGTTTGAASSRLATAERYDPATDRWTPVAPIPPAGADVTPRGDFTVTLLPDGQVLLAGGRVLREPACEVKCGPDIVLASTERYDPVSDRWIATAPMRGPRAGHAAALLPDGRVLVAGGFVSSGIPPTPPAELYTSSPASESCFAETGRCVRGPFLTYWQRHGGLAINGYPLSDEFVEVLEDGRAYEVQYFERVRLEHHPENPPPFDMLLGQFGRRIRPADPPAAPLPGQEYFAETGHNLGDGFLAYWQANGGLPQFGYPISEVFEERLEDGKVYRVQYFERARFEYHPESQAPYDILLGQFGRRILAQVERRR